MDMSQYLDMFLEESVENLQTLNEGILELEKNPEDKDTINSIFRVAHTLKGMAGSMGFTDIAELTHKMENVLDKFRNDELSVNNEVTNTLFKCLDTLEKMVNNVREGNDETVVIEDIIKALVAIEKGGSLEPEAPKAAAPVQSGFELNEYDKNIVKEAKDKNYNIYNIEVTVYKDCLLKAARAYLVYKTLEECGEIVKSVPSVEELEQENFDTKFSVMLITKKTIDEITSLVKGISEIEGVTTSEVNLDEKKPEVKPAEEPAKVEAAVSSEPEKHAAVSAPKENGAPKHAKDEEKGPKKITQSVRVDLERLDKLMNMVGELVIHRTRLEQISNSYKLTDLHETLEQVGRITSDLQDLVMKVRMLPVERVFNRFPRLVRDLAQELNKDIELIIEGQDTELDRTVIDELGEPLVHLIRNAVDHGIEQSDERMKSGKSSKGTVRLMAYQEGNKAVIKVEDDGKGLNIDKIKKKAQGSGINTDGMSDADIRNLIFMQGLSTSDKVTDVSGRGVGMDVVKTKIGAIGGTIDVLSEPGKGTSIVIKLPLTLSIIQALLVKIENESFAISLGFIDKVINVNINDIRKTNNKEVILYRGNVIPLVRVASLLNLMESESQDKFVVIVKVGEKTVGLLVDSLLGQQEIVIKSMGKTLQNLKEYVGATILGDGLVTLILDVAALV